MANRNPGPKPEQERREDGQTDAHDLASGLS
jgi:hypothetical protein